MKKFLLRYLSLLMLATMSYEALASGPPPPPDPNDVPPPPKGGNVPPPPGGGPPPPPGAGGGPPPPGSGGGSVQPQKNSTIGGFKLKKTDPFDMSKNERIYTSTESAYTEPPHKSQNDRVNKFASANQNKYDYDKNAGFETAHGLFNAITDSLNNSKMPPIFKNKIKIEGLQLIFTGQTAPKRDNIAFGGGKNPRIGQLENDLKAPNLEITRLKKEIKSAKDKYVKDRRKKEDEAYNEVYSQVDAIEQTIIDEKLTLKPDEKKRKRKADLDAQLKPLKEKLEKLEKELNEKTALLEAQASDNITGMKDKEDELNKLTEKTQEIQAELTKLKNQAEQSIQMDKALTWGVRLSAGKDDAEFLRKDDAEFLRSVASFIVEGYGENIISDIVKYVSPLSNPKSNEQQYGSMSSEYHQHQEILLSLIAMQSIELQNEVMGLLGIEEYKDKEGKVNYRPDPKNRKTHFDQEVRDGFVNNFLRQSTDDTYELYTNLYKDVPNVQKTKLDEVAKFKKNRAATREKEEQERKKEEEAEKLKAITGGVSPYAFVKNKLKESIGQAVEKMRDAAVEDIRKNNYTDAPSEEQVEMYFANTMSGFSSPDALRKKQKIAQDISKLKRKGGDKKEISALEKQFDNLEAKIQAKLKLKRIYTQVNKFFKDNLNVYYNLKTQVRAGDSALNKISSDELKKYGLILQKIQVAEAKKENEKEVTNFRANYGNGFDKILDGEKVPFLLYDSKYTGNVSYSFMNDRFLEHYKNVMAYLKANWPDIIK